MFEYLFIDLDDTIFDFHKAEYVAVGQLMASLGIDPTAEVRERYHIINLAHWGMLERKERTREQIVVDRFAVFFRELGVEADAAECANRYAENLSMQHELLPGAEKALEALSKKYRLFLASNGTGWVQKRRMKAANISHYFEKSFISEELGENKPDAAFFRRAFAEIPGFDPAKALMVGDSLSSDMLGANNAGIASCWVNPRHNPRQPDIPVDYEIRSLTELYPLLETLPAPVCK